MADFETEHLDQTNLNFFYYHRFLGLRFAETEMTDNITVVLNALFENHDQWKKLREQHQRITQYKAPIRFFYWLFNIDNYALNSHIVTAIHEIFLTYREMGFGKRNRFDEPIEITIGGWTVNVSLLQKAYHFFCSNSPVTALSTLKISKFETPDVFYNEPLDELMIQNTTTLTLLQLIGITKEINDLIKWSEIKKAYHERAKSLHPDKGGNKEAFVKLNQAYLELERMFYRYSNQDFEENGFEESKSQFVHKMFCFVIQKMEEERLLEKEKAESALLKEAEKKGLPKMPDLITQFDGRFFITEDMLDYLDFFGMTRCVNDQVTLREIATTYLLSGLVLQKKNPPGIVLMLKRLQATFTSLINLIFPNKINPIESTLKDSLRSWIQDVDNYLLGRESEAKKERNIAPPTPSAKPTDNHSPKQENEANQGVRFG